MVIAETVTVKTPIRDRDNNVVAKKYRVNGAFFCLCRPGARVLGPFESELEAEEEAIAYVQACEAMERLAESIG